MQSQKTNPYNKISELRLVEKIDSANLVTTYTVDAGFEGQSLKLKADGTFKETSYNCDGQEPMSSGTWKFDQGKLTLNADKGNYDYEFVAFREILFLVAPKGRSRFIKEFRRAFKEVSEDKEIDTQIRFSASVLRSMYVLYYHKWLY